MCHYLHAACIKQVIRMCPAAKLHREQRKRKYQVSLGGLLDNSLEESYWLSCTILVDTHIYVYTDTYPGIYVVQCCYNAINFLQKVWSIYCELCDLYSAVVIAILCVISWHIVPHHNGNALCMSVSLYMYIYHIYRRIKAVYLLLNHIVKYGNSKNYITTDDTGNAFASSIWPDITWQKVDQYLKHHITSLGHNELRQWSDWHSYRVCYYSRDNIALFSLINMKQNLIRWSVIRTAVFSPADYSLKALWQKTAVPKLPLILRNWIWVRQPIIYSAIIWMSATNRTRI